MSVDNGKTYECKTSNLVKEISDDKKKTYWKVSQTGNSSSCSIHALNPKQTYISILVNVHSQMNDDEVLILMLHKLNHEPWPHLSSVGLSHKAMTHDASRGLHNIAYDVQWAVASVNATAVMPGELYVPSFSEVLNSVTGAQWT